MGWSFSKAIFRTVKTVNLTTPQSLFIKQLTKLLAVNLPQSCQETLFIICYLFLLQCHQINWLVALCRWPERCCSPLQGRYILHTEHLSSNVVQRMQWIKESVALAINFTKGEEREKAGLKEEKETTNWGQKKWKENGKKEKGEEEERTMERR